MATPEMTLELATQAIEAARRRAEELGIRVSIAVADAGGHLVAFSRMDGAAWLTAEIAIATAYTASALGRPTIENVRSAENYPAFWQSLMVTSQGRLIMSQGGVPMVRNGKVVGSLGVSGGSGEQDALCAEAGASVAG